MGQEREASIPEVEGLDWQTTTTRAFYDVRKPVVLQCDASTEDLRATLLQEGCPVA